MALLRGRLHVPARDDLLALAHRHAQDLLLLLAREVRDELGRVGAAAEDADERDAGRRLLPGLLQVQRHALHELPPQRLRDVLLGRDERAVLAERLHQAHALEARNVVGVLGELLGLRGLLVVPRVPQLLVLAHRVQDALGACARLVREGPHLGQGHEVEPDRVGDPRLAALPLPGRLLHAHRVDVELRAAFKEDVHLGLLDLARGHEDLVGEHEREDHLVPLEEPALDVEEHRVGQVVYDVLDALARHHGLLRPVDAVVVELLELAQRRLVHAVDRRELGDEEVDERGAVRHGAELLAGLRDLLVRLTRDLQLRVDLLRRLLGVGKHVDELRVVQQVALGVGQPVQQRLLQLLNVLLVVVHLDQ